MSYSTEALVKAEFRSLDISGSTAVTSTDVAGFITEVDALIDSYVGARYTLPISDAADLAILQMISRQLVAWRIRGILEVKNADLDAANQDTKGGPTSQAELMKMLERIKSGDLVLAGSTVTSSKSLISSGNVDNEIEADFEMDVDQW